MLALTWPQFEYISCQLHRLQYQRAKNEVFFGIAAALGGEKNRKNLMESAGGFVERGADDAANMSYSEEELAAAMAKIDKIIARQSAAEQEEDNV